MKRYLVEEHPNYSVKHPKILYIDRHGKIYPDCKTYKTPAICHISDADAERKIKDEVFGKGLDGIFNMVTVEVSSRCQANCVYCFQRDAHRQDLYEYYGYLLPLLQRLNTYWLFFSGGEILIQQDAMDFIAEYKKQCPKTWIHLKTNGNVERDVIDFVNDTCDSIMVSFNGFSDTTYQTIMGIGLETAKRFCMAVKECGKTNLGLKLLNSPITIAETPEFLEWALSQNPQCIAIQVAYNYEVEASGKSTRLGCTLPDGDSSLYWTDIYKRISSRCERVLLKHIGEINAGKNYLTADKELLKILSLSETTSKLFRTDGVYVIE